MEYFSQLGADKWIAEKIFPGVTTGFFVDAGADDGMTLSNTLALAKLGWKGILVEPAHAFDALKKNRPESICLNEVLMSRSGMSAPFINKGMGSNIHGFGVLSGPIIERKAKSLGELLFENKAPNFIEYLSLDTEGSEYEILREFPFETYRFGAMTIEHNEYNGPVYRTNRLAMQRLLVGHGYVLVATVNQDDWYVSLDHYVKGFPKAEY